MAAPERDVLDELRAAGTRKWAGDPAAQRAGLFSRAANEIEDLRRDLDENAALRERMADLLRSTAVALRGPEPPLTRWGWHDLPERAAAAVAAERERWQKSCGAIAGDLRNHDMVRLGAAKCLDAGNRA
ncbi:MAG: hypothetical protein ACK5X3_06470 [Pseudomonadota bacterium]